jgi:hypothetical protein
MHQRTAVLVVDRSTGSETPPLAPAVGDGSPVGQVCALALPDGRLWLEPATADPAKRGPDTATAAAQALFSGQSVAVVVDTSGSAKSPGGMTRSTSTAIPAVSRSMTLSTFIELE